MAKPRLFIADADPRSLRILELALRKAGFAVESAMDGAQALQRVQASPPDLFICEASLPSQDGLAVCRALRVAHPLLPIVVTSADKSLAPRALEAGADEFLRKPILLRELVQRAQALLEKRELLQGSKTDFIRGSMRELGLLDALQALLLAQTSAVVSCEAYGRTARLWVREGQVVDAELGPLGGDAAFFRLMTWESGSFRIEPQAVDREPRIEGGTEASLVEAMRRTEELGRASEELPMTSVLAVDYPRLAEDLADLPDEVNGVVRSFDGRRTLREAIDRSPVDDLNTLLVVRRLIAAGILRAVESKATALRPSLDQWLSDPPPVEELLPEELVTEPPAPQEAARPALSLVRFPPLRGVRRERLRREAEEARVRIAEGAAVRLSRVVELPPHRSDGSDALGAPGRPEGSGRPSRWMSPAVGEAAKKFAPDAPVARLINGGPTSEGEMQLSYRPQATPVATPPISPVSAPPIAPVSAPPIAPVAVTTPPIQAIVPGTPPPDRGFEAALRKTLVRRKRRWLWIPAGVTVALIVAALLLRRQPDTDRKDAPWLAPAAVEHVPPPSPVKSTPAERAAPTADAPPAAAAEPPPPAVAGSASEQLYKRALALGEQQLRAGKYREAIAHFRRAVRERPQAAPALLALGDAYLEADKPRSAVPPLESAARLDPASGRAQLLLGTAWQSLGQNAKALKAYRRYLELEPKGEYARDVRLILANLGH